MTQLNRVYSMRRGNVEFEFRPQHKFNFIIGDSGSGKSFLYRLLSDGQESQDFYPLNYVTCSVIDLSVKYNSMFIVDESQFIPVVEHYGWAKLQDTHNVFLIISRNIPAQLSVDYRAVYSLCSKDRKYWLERVYSDYTDFPMTDAYITEDKGSGYYYYNAKYANVDSCEGKDNNLPIKSDRSTTLIADGSAFARKLPAICSNYPDISLFLPESFEGLVISGTPGKLSAKLMHNAYSDAVLNYRSIEQYFNSAIRDLYPDYSKSKKQPYLVPLDIEHVQHYDVDAELATKFNISRFDPIACREIKNKQTCTTELTTIAKAVNKSLNDYVDELLLCAPPSLLSRYEKLSKVEQAWHIYRVLNNLD